MTQLSREDRQLVRFLQEYHPRVPGASTELESQIMRAVLLSVPAPQHRLPWRLLSFTLVASGLITGVSYRLLMPSQPADVTHLEGVPGWEDVIIAPSDPIEISSNSSSFWQEVSGIEKRFFEQR